MNSQSQNLNRISLTIITICYACFTYAQHENSINFDDSYSDTELINIDTVSNPNNIWRIGIPSKNLFDSAYSNPRAILTDTLSPYPVNDSSTFTLKYPRYKHGAGTQAILLDFWFQMDSDTITDFGRIEISSEKIEEWIDLYDADDSYYIQWLHPKPVLSGSSNGWTKYSIDVSGMLQTLVYPDTIFYRFTFISDDIYSGKDGWIIDDITLFEIWEGIGTQTINKPLTILPNPSNGQFIVSTEESNLEESHLSIFDMDGKEVLNIEIDGTKRLDTDLEPGIYIIRVITREEAYVNYLIINR